MSRYFLILWSIVAIYSGPIAYCQYALLGKTLIAPNYIWILLTVHMLFIVFIKIIESNYLLPKKHLSLLRVSLLFVATTIFAALISRVLGINQSSIIDLIVRAYIYFVTPIISILFKSRIILRLDKSSFFIVASFLPLAILGILQCLTNSTIINANIISGELDIEAIGSIKSIGGYAVYGGNFLGIQLRAFSVFRSPLELGYASLFCWFLCFSSFIHTSKNRLFFALAGFVSAAAALSTLTRNITISLFLGTFFILIITVASKFPKSKFKLSRQSLYINDYLRLSLGDFIAFIAKKIPMLLILLAIFSLLSVSEFFEFDQNSESFFSRIDTWSILLKDLRYSPLKFFLGNGSTFLKVSSYLYQSYDNTYLGILAFSGGLSLISFLVLYFHLYKKSIEKLIIYEKKDKFFWVATTTFLFSFFTLSFFNDISANWFVFAFPSYVFLLYDQDSKETE